MFEVIHLGEIEKFKKFYKLSGRERIAGIYRICNNINGKIYVGLSTNIFRRIKDHTKNKKSLIGRAINKYGIENFTFYIDHWEKNDNIKGLPSREEIYIKIFNSGVRSLGYNIITETKNFNIESLSKKRGYIPRKKREVKNFYTFISPEGKEYTTNDVKKFCEENNLNLVQAYAIQRGGNLSHKNWIAKNPKSKCACINCGKKVCKDRKYCSTCSSEENGRMLEIMMRTPDGKIIKINNLKKFCRENNLVYSSMFELVSNKRNSCNGWRLIK